jgi:putative transposase
MSHPVEIQIEHHMSIDELNKRIKTLEHDTKVLRRLYFIKYRYEGKLVSESAKLVGITKRVGYIWQERWNEKGYEGLIPRYGGGRPSKLTDAQKERLVELLKQNDTWTTEEIRELIFNEFKVEYTSKQIRIILKNMGMRCAKPFSHDYRRPKNAEEILKKFANNG